MNIDIFIIYETTNLINNKKYRGIHKTVNLNDGYIGSGFAFKNAVKKHGKENFKREILEYCNSYDELIEKEKIYVDEKWINDDSNYNIKTGGQSAGIMSIESRKKLSNSLKMGYASGKIIQNSPNKGIPMPEEIKKKISNTLKEKYEKEEHPSIGKTLSSGSWKKGNVPWNKGLKTGPLSEENKKKKSEALKERYSKIVHHLKGRKFPNSTKKGTPSPNKGKSMEQFECPHCGKLSNKGNCNRWHFDNCKLKNKEGN